MADIENNMIEYHAKQIKNYCSQFTCAGCKFRVPESEMECKIGTPYEWDLEVEDGNI